jgi:hypothetical protein
MFIPFSKMCHHFHFFTECPVNIIIIIIIIIIITTTTTTTTTMMMMMMMMMIIIIIIKNNNLRVDLLFLKSKLLHKCFIDIRKKYNFLFQTGEYSRVTYSNVEH